MATNSSMTQDDSLLATGNARANLREMLHNVRTYLTVIAGHAQLMQRRVSGRSDLPGDYRAQIERSARAIGASSRALGRLIDELDPDTRHRRRQ